MPLLPEADYPRGNIRRYESGVSVSVSEEQADRMRIGRRQHRSGLLYDESHSGFCPCLWPHVVHAPLEGGEGGVELMLESSVPGEGAQLLSVRYSSPSTAQTQQLMHVAHVFESEHARCRETDIAAGEMFGVGDHVAYDGYLHHFSTSDRHARQRVASAMEVAGRIFARELDGRSGGWHASWHNLLQHQAALWPPGTPPWPMCWDASRDLGNAMHIDPDADRSIAVWLAERPYQSRSWWLLFPRHGVAVQLTHGTWVTWDGRCMPHATAVPSVAEGDRLYSLFTSLPRFACNALARCVEGRAQQRERSVEGGALGHIVDRLSVGVLVGVRTVRPAPPHITAKRALREWGRQPENVRWVRSRVISVSRDAVRVREVSSHRDVELSRLEAGNRLCLL